MIQAAQVDAAGKNLSTSDKALKNKELRTETERKRSKSLSTCAERGLPK
jgi:hypothetical protein